jgi:hypothetical protein
LRRVEEDGQLQEENLPMNELPPASSRPSRLSVAAHIVVVGSLAISFFSGMALWYGQNASAETLAPAEWLHSARVVHGALNPVLCAVFGYLVSQHIRYGWALRANWVTGLIMEVVFAALIVSALAVYYADEGPMRNALVWVHRIVGAAVPAVVAGHWVAARMWIKKIYKPLAIETQSH